MSNPMGTFVKASSMVRGDDINFDGVQVETPSLPLNGASYHRISTERLRGVTQVNVFELPGQGMTVAAYFTDDVPTVDTEPLDGPTAYGQPDGVQLANGVNLYIAISDLLPGSNDYFYNLSRKSEYYLVIVNMGKTVSPFAARAYPPSM